MSASSDDDRAIVGLWAAGWLGAYAALAEMSSLAPDGRVALGVAGWGEPLVQNGRDCLDLVGEETEQHVEPVRQAVASFGHHLRPRTWPEAVLKVHLMVGAGLDLVELTRSTWPENSRHVVDVTVARELEGALGETLDPYLGDEDERSRLGLFGRRLVAEATAQAQRVAAARPRLAQALSGDEEGSLSELAATTQLIADLVEGSAQRLMRLGLQP